MSAVPIVEAFEVVEYRGSGVLPGGPRGAVEKLGLERGEEALWHRIDAPMVRQLAHDRLVSGE
jgi:hypothetical protein